MSRAKREHDPLNCIPSAEVIRRRLKATEETARKLRVLLKTAEAIEVRQEREPRDESEVSHVAK